MRWPTKDTEIEAKLVVDSRNSDFRDDKEFNSGDRWDDEKNL